MVSYADDCGPGSGFYEVVYIVKATGVKLVRSFDDEAACYRFVNKLRHSGKCTLISYPFFS